MTELAGEGPEIEWLDTVGSTNEVAQQRFASGWRSPLWIAAGEQTGGRGRLGREWVSTPGNLYASLLLPTATPVATLPLLSLVAALAVRDAFAAAGFDSAIELKWPNDVLLAGSKASGILLETVTSAGSLAAIIGCGLNLAHHPAQTRWPATHLGAHGVNISAPDMLLLLVAGMRARLTQWAQGSGSNSICRDWDAAAMGRGSRVSVSEQVSGVFTGIAGNGAMKVLRDDGSEWLHSAGDVNWLEVGKV